MHDRSPRQTLTGALLLAVAAPPLLAYNISPSATLLNQLLSVAGWGVVIWALGRALTQAAPGHAAPQPHRPLLLALGLLLAGVLASWATGLPAALALQALTMLGVTMVLVVAVSSRGSERAASVPDATDDVHLFASAMLVAAIASAVVACLQVFAPQWTDGVVVSRTGLPGRAVGNLRQPNHLSTLLLWGLISLVPLAEAGRWFGRPLARWAAAALGALLVLGVVLTASRTGTLGMVVLAVWGLLDKRLPKWLRGTLLAAPLVYVAFWLAMAGWAHQTAQTFGGEARLGEGDLSASRFSIWRNTWQLILAHPVGGVGWGRFNHAWTLTPFPDRPVAFFDHSHNLPLQLAVELGVPAAVVLMGLLLWTLVEATRRAWAAPGDSAPRAAIVIVWMVGLHSLLEYPLWYAYFLLPTAWALGIALRQPRPPEAPEAAARAGRPLQGLGALIVLGAVVALMDYGRVTTIFVASDGGLSLQQRIERGRHSVFFAHHADYAAVTTTDTPASAMASFPSATHALLDTRLMIAWARALEASGQRDKARYLVARLREFRNPDAAEFLAACDAPRAASEPAPFQCEPPQQSYAPADFRR